MIVWMLRKEAGVDLLGTDDDVVVDGGAGDDGDRHDDCGGCDGYDAAHSLWILVVVVYCCCWYLPRCWLLKSAGGQSRCYRLLMFQYHHCRRCPEDNYSLHRRPCWLLYRNQPAPRPQQPWTKRTMTRGLPRRHQPLSLWCSHSSCTTQDLTGHHHWPSVAGVVKRSNVGAGASNLEPGPVVSEPEMARRPKEVGGEDPYCPYKTLLDGVGEGRKPRCRTSFAFTRQRQLLSPFAKEKKSTINESGYQATNPLLSTYLVPNTLSRLFRVEYDQNPGAKTPRNSKQHIRR